MAVNKLAHQTQQAAGIPNGMRTAVVAAVSGTQVTINVSGGLFSSGVGFLSSYTPTVGDIVAVFRQDSSWLIMGTMASSSGGGGTRRVATAIMTSDMAVDPYASEVAMLTLSFNAIAGQKYSFFGQARCSSAAVSTGALYRIREDSVAGTSNSVARMTMDNDSAGVTVSIYGEWTAPSTGSKTILLTIIQRPAAATNLTPRNLSWLYVETVV